MPGTSSKIASHSGPCVPLMTFAARNGLRADRQSKMRQLVPGGAGATIRVMVYKHLHDDNSELVHGNFVRHPLAIICAQ